MTSTSPLGFCLALVLVAAGCVGPRSAAELPETREALARALTARGWVVEPTDLVNAFGVEAPGTAYLVRRQNGDRRRLVTFEAPETDDGPNRAALDGDFITLRQQLAGQSAVFYRRPDLLVVTFGPGRTELDLRLSQLLGPPVSTAE